MLLEEVKKIVNTNRKNNKLALITGEHNIELIAMNGYTNVATGNQWYKLKRTNIKGLKPLELSGLSKYKDKKTGEEKENYFIFKVYDITQTRELTEEELKRWRIRFGEE